jgi:hypothetical protein
MGRSACNLKALSNKPFSSWQLCKEDVFALKNVKRKEQNIVSEK